MPFVALPEVTLPEDGAVSPCDLDGASTGAPQPTIATHAITPASQHNFIWGPFRDGTNMVTQENRQVVETRADRLGMLLEPYDVVRCGVPRMQCGSDVAQLTRHALSHPLGDAPPLAQFVVPGDRVVLALDTGLPAVAACVATVVTQLLESGIEPASIGILRTAKEARLGDSDCSAYLPEEVTSRLQWLTHTRSNADRWTYLASTRGDHRVYVHPALAEADVVIPIGKYRPPEETFGVHQSWFPRFSDAGTWRRFQPRAKATTAQRELEAQEVAWLLGMQFIVQLLPGGDTPVLDVVAGDPTAVQAVARDRWYPGWQFPVLDPVPLVVANLSGNRAEQTWSHLIRAIEQAETILEDNGVLAICTNLQTRPGPALRQLMRLEDWSTPIRLTSRFPDATLAGRLLDLQRRRRIYLLSRLDEQTVESLQFVPIAAIDEVARLAGQFDRLVMLDNAQYAVPQLGTE